MFSCPSRNVVVSLPKLLIKSNHRRSHSYIQFFLSNRFSHIRGFFYEKTVGTTQLLNELINLISYCLQVHCTLHTPENHKPNSHETAHLLCEMYKKWLLFAIVRSMNTAQGIGRLQSLGKPLPSDDVERKSVKEKDGHFTARGQRARCTVADCGPIVGCGSRPAFVDPRDTLSCARARPRCFHAPSGGGERYEQKAMKSAHNAWGGSRC